MRIKKRPLFRLPKLRLMFKFGLYESIFKVYGLIVSHMAVVKWVYYQGTLRTSVIIQSLPHPKHSVDTPWATCRCVF